MDLIALSAEITIAGGEAGTSHGVPGLLAQPAPTKAARGRERDYLFAHLALTGPQAETDPLAEELLRQLSARFYQTGGSVTAALRRAVLDLNERLLHVNLQNRTNYEGAITTAVLHGDELFTLQAGEALAFLGHNFGVERLPARKPDLITPLGRSAGIDFRFAYNRLQIGDMMLLADPRLAHLNGTTLSSVLVDSDIESGIDGLVDVTGDDNARLLLMEFTDEVPATLPVNLTPQAPPRVSTPRKQPAPAAAAVPAAAEPAAAQGPVRESGRPPLRAVGVPTISSAAVETKARQAAAQSARGLSEASGWLAVLVSRLRPAEPPPDEERIGWAIPTAIAILVPIMMVVVVASVFLQQGTVQQLGEIKTAMIQQTLLAQDVQSIDPAQAQIYYNSVLALAAEAESIRPGDTEVLRMRNEARDFLDQLDGVTRLLGRPLAAFGDDALLAGVELGDEEEGSLFLSEETAGSVLFQPISDGLTEAAGETSQIAFLGQSVGTQTVGPIVDILWRDTATAATRQGLAMLDRAGVLYTYYPNLGDIRSVPLDPNDELLNPQAMAEFADRLYVLDTISGMIWKYFPEGEGFVQNEEDKAIFFSDQADLGSAVDFDLYSEDGSMIVIYADGRVRYYDTRSGRIQWDETTLLANGLSSPLVSPVAVEMVGRGLNASIYILDPGSSRLVQVSRAGIVVSQYRILDEQDVDLLRQSRDFAVAETPLRVFVTVGDQIYVATRGN